jgi:hypothetical protein
VVLATAVVVIAASAVVGPRLGIAAPLVLVAIGVADLDATQIAIELRGMWSAKPSFLSLVGSRSARTAS